MDSVHLQPHEAMKSIRAPASSASGHSWQENDDTGNASCTLMSRKETIRSQVKRRPGVEATCHNALLTGSAKLYTFEVFSSTVTFS